MWVSHSGVAFMHTSPDRRRMRLFGHPWLEALTVVTAPAFICLWALVLPLIFVCALVTAPDALALLWIALGVAVWTIAEYALHRFVFHFDAQSAFLKRAIFIIHGNHHADPNDPLRNLMPPVVSLPIGALLWVASVGLFGASGSWGFLGFMLGYVAYDLVHYACHQWPMKGRVGRLIKVHHMRHHHLRAGGNYAVTAIAWDRFLSTRITSSRERV